MKKIILAITVFIMTAGLLISCGNREYDEAEVSAAAKSLISDAVILNEIYWGDGIPYSDDRGLSDGVYFPSLYLSEQKYGFETVEELKEKTRKVFSEEFCETVFSTVLSSINDGNEMFLSRYYQKYSVIDGVTPEYIMVNSDWNKVFTSTVEYDFDSIKVIGSEKQTVFVTIDCTVTKSGYDPQKRTLTISLIEEEDGWKLDSPTFVNYDITKVNK
ncbi:MAG: hypothetical protein J6Q68_04035 [Clostridia bacterium]|nr:hypothetical protein [Clostridia bacterium]